MKYCLIFLHFFFLFCSPSNTPSQAELAWLSFVKNTSWVSNSQTLKFDSSGKNAINGIYLYTYDFSNDGTTAVYFTQIDLIPQQWFLLKIGEELIQYGPFNSKNQVTQDTTKILFFTKSQ